MKIHHLVIFVFKMLFLLLVVLVKLKAIPADTPLENIVDYTFKLLLGIFVLYVSPVHLNEVRGLEIVL